ncbi:MAG TPA: LodA/GoxA family CTQ-dependent oxidase [Candidatus Methylomirabilis sp.]|nr:LodA/GoxA family CTQ-dependent oxidase [Candidatus Methylomirabilis sp.]
MADKKSIVRCAIHPAIGIARIGNAPADQYYLAPEVPGRAAVPGPGGFKNDKGQVRKEACRFRIYGYDRVGNVVREIAADDAEITWEVHLANRKAAWYQFFNAMDLKQYALSTTYRNGTITGASRQSLVIDPGPIAIGGRKTSGPEYRFDGGFIRFGSGEPIRVPLGELRTDEMGRLLVLGGDGTSASATNQPAITFANNEGWYDDVSDGPVRARVKLVGRRDALDAEPAMVAVTPPNFGPGLYGVVTMYDVVYDLFARHGWLAPPKRLTFWEQIFPLFERLVNSQWVNQGAYFLFGAGSPGDLTEPATLKKLADPSRAARGERKRVFEWFRLPPPPWDAPGARATLPPPQPAHLPPFYGDGFGEYTEIAIDELALTQTLYGWLKRWAEGDFVPGERRRPPQRLSDLPLAAQPGALDRTPLEDCLGGPFHPGIELTWPMRVPRMWRPPSEARGLPFRLHILPPGVSPRDDFGAVLTPDVCIGPDGPLAASGPGSLTRWLGVPWQTDEASCLAGYDASNYLPIPSFWAARVPNQVLSEHAYHQSTDRRLSYVQRLKSVAYRQFWLRDLQGKSYQDRINNMVKEWSLLGIVAEHTERADRTEPGLPVHAWVETQRSASFSDADPTWRQLLMVEGIQPTTGLLQQAATPLLELAAEREVKPSEIVHPHRRAVRRDER